MWDLCCDISAVGVGISESSCSEYEEDGNCHHFGRDGRLFGEKSEVVGLKRELRDHFEVKTKLHSMLKSS